MTDGEDAPGPDSAPLDFDRLELISDRLRGDKRFTEIKEPTFASERLICVYNLRLYPLHVTLAQIEIAWYENGDFSVHYHEEHANKTFDHRWDRHLSSHNSRDHIHPGPDAPTPGDDASHPDDWRDVLSNALTEIESRQRGFWSN